MRFLADEDFPLPSVRVLLATGYDVAAAILDSPPGDSDGQVLRRAANEGRILLTFDRDHGRLLYRQDAPIPEGVIYFRLDPSSPEEPARRLIGLLNMDGFQANGFFTVVRQDRVRQRSLPRS